MRPRLGRSAKSAVTVVAAYPGVQPLDLLGPLEVFGAANALAARAPLPYVPYDIVLASPDGREVELPNGLVLRPKAALARHRGAIDTLLIPGAFDVNAMLGVPGLLSGARRAARRAARVASVCTGAFLLAECGLLDGKRATTHWAACSWLASRYPSIEVLPDPIYVRDGAFYTSAGVTAGMDLALALVEDDLGRDVAIEIARWLVMYVKRSAGQPQLSASLAAQRAGRGALDELLTWIAEHPGADLRVGALARRAHMSPRTFARSFRRELGVTPARFVARVRIEAARRRLEETDEPLKLVAERSGFGSIESLRRGFHAAVGVTPGDYRARVRSRS